MDVIEKVLALRPTNAVMRLGQTSRLPVLNPRDIARAVDDRALLCLPVPQLQVLPGLLRAAREADAVMGLASPYTPLDRDAPYRFVDALRAAAQETGYERPLFLQAGPVRLTGADERALTQATEQVFRYLDAGFSLLSIDGSRLPAEEHERACTELSAAAAERELTVEVTAPRLEDGRTSPEALDAFLSGLTRGNLRPRFVRVHAALAPVPGEGAHEDARLLDGELMAELSRVASGYNVSLTLEDPGQGALQSLSGWFAQGARKVDAVAALGKVSARALDAGLRQSLQEKADAAHLPLTEVLAQSDQFFRGVDAAALERVEALSFAEALDLLEALRAPGTASRCLSFLAEQAGY